MSETTACGPACMVEPVVVFDRPQEGEVIRSPEYLFRIGARKDAESVEIRINQGPWEPCRKADGYWWHDWSGYRSGDYELAARITPREGEAPAARRRSFLVRLAARPRGGRP